VVVRRIHAKTERTPEEKERIRQIRERFQRERPTLEELVASGDCAPPVPQGAYRQLRVLMHALKTAREQQGLSLADVAERSGIDKAALSRLETGAQTNPTIDTLWRYAYAIGKDLAWAVGDLRGTGQDASTILSQVEQALENATGLLREAMGRRYAPTPTPTEHTVSRQKRKEKTTMIAITGRNEIARAYEVFARTVSEGGHSLERMVGYKGGSEMASLLWHSTLQLWVLLQPDRLADRYWCAFGTDDPVSASMLSIACEINPPREGINRRCAGLFVRDDSGAVFIAHSGKIGGGRPGIGKSRFMQARGQQDVVSVQFPDGLEGDYIVLGRIDDQNLLARLAEFVRAIAQFKQEAATGGA
jgi:transcriptional regulator with XRE-family HTH domain